jgi:hypothetical protein
MRLAAAPVDERIEASLLKLRALMSRSHLHTLDQIAGPPPEVLDEVEAAWERAQELSGDDLELHFESDPFEHRAWAELRLGGGRVARRLSPSEALALACGDDLPLSV